MLLHVHLHQAAPVHRAGAESLGRNGMHDRSDRPVRDPCVVGNRFGRVARTDMACTPCTCAPAITCRPGHLDGRDSVAFPAVIPLSDTMLSGTPACIFFRRRSPPRNLDIHSDREVGSILPDYRRRQDKGTLPGPWSLPTSIGQLPPWSTRSIFPHPPVQERPADIAHGSVDPRWPEPDRPGTDFRTPHSLVRAPSSNPVQRLPSPPSPALRAKTPARTHPPRR